MASAQLVQTTMPSHPVTVNTQEIKEEIQKDFDLEHDTWQEKNLRVPVNIL
jgi:hypothetical protein